MKRHQRARGFLEEVLVSRKPVIKMILILFQEPKYHINLTDCFTARSERYFK